MRLAGVLPRMEHPRPPLLPAARLLCFAHDDDEAVCDSRDVCYQLAGARVGHGVYHEEVQGLWVFYDDDADADCDGAEAALGYEADVVEQCAVLV